MYNNEKRNKFIFSVDSTTEWKKEFLKSNERSILQNILDEHNDTAKYSEFNFNKLREIAYYLDTLNSISLLDSDVFISIDTSFDVTNAYDLKEKQNLVFSFVEQNLQIINDINNFLEIDTKKLYNIVIKLQQENAKLLSI
jgi:hypothetical protein